MGYSKKYHGYFTGYFMVYPSVIQKKYHGYFTGYPRVIPKTKNP
jgi:hypothetical protein